jgi:hypothetical protein
MTGWSRNDINAYLPQMFRRLRDCSVYNLFAIERWPIKACSVLVSIPRAAQGVAGSMPHHVSMDREWQLSGLAKPFYELLTQP